MVIDASVTMAWCFADESAQLATDALDALVSNLAVVPQLWPLEIVNVLAIGERRGRITPAESAQFIGRVEQLPIEVDDHSPRDAMKELLTVARANQLSSYDAAYVELALRRGLPLITLDQRLSAVANTLGISTAVP